jgi:hypothetical protein
MEMDISQGEMYLLNETGNYVKGWKEDLTNISSFIAPDHETFLDKCFLKASHKTVHDTLL